MPAIALDGPRRAPTSGRAPKQLVVLLHGLGSDGEDIGALAPLLAAGLPHAAFASPNAPFANDAADFGRQWFSLGDTTPSRLEAGVREAAESLDAFIAEERARLGLLPRNVALVGFSQGAMMALWSGLRRDPGVGAVLSYAGAVIGAESLVAELRWLPPVLLVHGMADTVIPPAFSEVGERQLRALSVPVRALFRRGLAHTLDDECIAAGAAFLADWADGKLVTAAPRPAPVPAQP